MGAALGGQHLLIFLRTVEHEAHPRSRVSLNSEGPAPARAAAALRVDESSQTRWSHCLEGRKGVERGREVAVPGGSGCGGHSRAPPYRKGQVPSKGLRKNLGQARASERRVQGRREKSVSY